MGGFACCLAVRLGWKMWSQEVPLERREAKGLAPRDHKVVCHSMTIVLPEPSRTFRVAVWRTPERASRTRFTHPEVGGVHSQRSRVKKKASPPLSGFPWASRSMPCPCSHPYHGGGVWGGGGGGGVVGRWSGCVVGLGASVDDASFASHHQFSPLHPPSCLPSTFPFIGETPLSPGLCGHTPWTHALSTHAHNDTGRASCLHSASKGQPVTMGM